MRVILRSEKACIMVLWPFPRSFVARSETRTDFRSKAGGSKPGTLHCMTRSVQTGLPTVIPGALSVATGPTAICLPGM